MPDSRERLEIEIGLRDTKSAGLKLMGRELENINRKAQEIGQGSGGTGAMEKFRKESERLHETHERNKKSLTGMSDIIGDMTKKISGPAGLVGAMYSAAKQLEEFAASRLQLQ